MRIVKQSRIIGLALLLAAVTIAATAVAQDDSQGPISEAMEELNVSVGENRTLPAGSVKSYSEGVRGIAQIKLTPDGSHFVIVGQKPGSTTLLLIMKNGDQHKYAINVFPRAMESVDRELRQLLNGTTGIRIRRVGARFFIEGGVSSEPELERIQRIASLYPEQVESLVVLGGVAAERKLNIRIDFFFVQFDKTSSYQAGVNWPTSVTGGVVSSQYDLLANSVTTAQASIVEQPLPGLDIAATHGWAKVLKHSAVVTSNGSEANFESGGEQNYIVSTDFAASLTQIEFGTRVRVLPRFDPETNELEVRLTAEVLDLTPPVAAGTNLPGRNVSKLETLVALKLGQSIVLSGIRSRSARQSRSGIPGLSEIPILGLLFASQGRNNEEVEGAIFVVPSVIESVPRSAREIIDDALGQYKSYRGKIRDIDTWDQDPEKAPGVRMSPDVPSPRPEKKSGSLAPNSARKPSEKE